MKFQPDRLAGTNVIARFEASFVQVNDQRHVRSLLVPWAGEVQAWVPNGFNELQPAHFEALLGLQPDLVIFGSGARLRFAPPSLYRSLIERGIGIETMDSAAACRTFNVLAAEGRKVVCALLMEPAS